MNQKIGIALVVVLALIAAGYLWYASRETPLPPQLHDGQLGNPEPPSEAVIETSIEGQWRSINDPAFTRTFGADGTVTDRYTGDDAATVSGRYELDGSRVPAQVAEVADGRPVLAIEFPEERLFFLVATLNADMLELVYVGGNGMLRFERI